MYLLQGSLNVAASKTGFQTKNHILSQSCIKFSSSQFHGQGLYPQESLQQRVPQETGR